MKLPSKRLGRSVAYRSPDSFCPHCGQLWTGAGTTPDEPHPRQPEPGDPAVCIGCAALNVYGDDLLLRAVTDADLDDWVKQPGLLDHLREAQRRVALLIARVVRETGKPPQGKPTGGRS